MPKSFLSSLSVIALCILISCKKSTGGSDGNNFTIANQAGVQIKGSYVLYIPCDTSHYITVPVQVNDPGPWSLETDLANGVKFSGSGQFTSKGAQVIKLFATGTPTSSEKPVYKVRVGSTEASVSFVPMKSSVNIMVNNTNVQGGELFYPLTFTWVARSDIDSPLPICQVYNVNDPNGNLRLTFEYKDPAFYSLTTAERWELFTPAMLGIADINHPDMGFKLTLKTVDSYYELTSDKIANDADQYVQIISRGTYVPISGVPVYIIKINFSAKIADDFNNQQTVSGTAVLPFFPGG